ncbi:MAG: glycosyltransferase family 1 protein [Planctomycetota bacterium]|nr:glycosyltransferase family 1 protein [Planctomycetota bacterium]MDG1985687.1 glycosyltransferase family 1 protein [Planctomycetota bacterium]
MSSRPTRPAQPGAPLAPLLDYRPALVGGQGVGRYVRELAAALASTDGVDLRLFGPTRQRVPRSAPPGARLFAPRLPSKALTALVGATGLGVERLLGGGDVVHHTQYRRLPTGRPEVAMIHDLVFLDSDRYVSPRVARRMSAFVREAARRCAVLLTPSEAVADEVAERLEVDRSRVRATHLGVDHALRMVADGTVAARLSAEVERDGPFLFTAARIETRKNLEVILRALERLGPDAPRWKVAGVPGEGAEAFEMALAASPVSDRVERLGHVSEGALRAHLDACSAFVLVPHDEGFGLAPLEAMAVGCPAISSDVPVVREVCGGGADLVAPGDDEALAAAILRALEASGKSASSREDAAGRSRLAVDHASRFTWAGTAAQTLAAYRFAARDGA